MLDKRRTNIAKVCLVVSHPFGFSLLPEVRTARFMAFGTTFENVDEHLSCYWGKDRRNGYKFEHATN